MSKSNESDLVEVFAGTQMDAEILSSILKDAEIETFLKDEFMGTIAPWQSSAGGVGAVKVIVSSNNIDRAKSIVAEFRYNMNSKK